MDRRLSAWAATDCIPTLDTAVLHVQMAEFVNEQCGGTFIVFYRPWPLYKVMDNTLTALQASTTFSSTFSLSFLLGQAPYPFIHSPTLLQELHIPGDVFQSLYSFAYSFCLAWPSQVGPSSSLFECAPIFQRSECDEQFHEQHYKHSHEH